ncbi:hypothetical protein RB601_000849 [Gaeumannomyces tritici]
MESHELLLQWAEAQGIELRGIRPDRIPGRGIGIIATRKLKEGELLLRVPTTALRTKFTVPKEITRRLPRTISVHGLLAADLALDASGRYDEWNAVLPSPADVEAMPFCWPRELQDLLPRRAAELLRKQRAKFARDWEAVSAAAFSLPRPATVAPATPIPSSSPADTDAKQDSQQQQQQQHHDTQPLDEARYRYAWLLANTRTFYYVDARTARLPREDRMVLQPVADLFNHATGGGCCPVAFGDADFTVRSGAAHEAGAELSICYGNHSNDFLLAEYGFVLDGDGDGGGNRFDEVCLDDVLLPRLSARQRDLLEARDFLGNYALDRQTACYRTEVALRLLTCCPPSSSSSSSSTAAWEAFVDGGEGGEGRQKEAADRLLRDLLAEHRRGVVRGRLAALEGARMAAVGTAAQRGLLATRWRQIDGLLGAAIQRLEEGLDNR